MGEGALWSAMWLFKNISWATRFSYTRWIVNNTKRTLSPKVERRDTEQDYAHPRMQLLPSIGKVVAMRRGQTQPVSALTFRAHQTATPTIQRCQQCLCTCHELDTRNSVAPPRGAPTMLSLKTRKSQRRQTPRQHTNVVSEPLCGGRCGCGS